MLTLNFSVVDLQEVRLENGFDLRTLRAKVIQIMCRSANKIFLISVTFRVLCDMTLTLTRTYYDTYARRVSSLAL